MEDCTTKQEVRSVLEAPFTQDQIKQRKGLRGRTLDYIERHSVIATKYAFIFNHFLDAPSVARTRDLWILRTGHGFLEFL